MNRDDTSAFQTMFLDFKKDVKDDFKEMKSRMDSVQQSVNDDFRDMKSSIDTVQRSVSVLGKDVSIIQNTLTTHGRTIDDFKTQVHSDKSGWISMIRTAFYVLTTIVTIGAGLGAAFYTCSGGKF